MKIAARSWPHKFTCNVGGCDDPVLYLQGWTEASMEWRQMGGGRGQIHLPDPWNCVDTKLDYWIIMQYNRKVSIFIG